MRLFNQATTLVEEVQNELPKNFINSSKFEIYELLEEMIFQKLKNNISEEESLKNEQIKHRFNILQNFIDFSSFGVEESLRSQQILKISTCGKIQKNLKK